MYQGLELTRSDLKSGSVLHKLVPALQNNEVYLVLPHNWYDINYENILINAYYIGKILYSKEFKDIELQKKADEIYKAFLGKSVYCEMLSTTGGCQKYEEIK